MRFLVDINTFRHPAVSRWEHQDDQLMMWGPMLIGLRRYHWRFKSSSSPEIAKEIPFVPALGTEGGAKCLRFFTYQLLELESWTVRPAVDWARRSIPDLFNLERLRTRYDYSGILMGNGVSLSEGIRRFVDHVADPRLTEIKTILGPKHTQDAFHLFVCEEKGLDGLVTLDLKLKRHFEQSKSRLKSPVKVLLPSEICKAVGIEAVGPEWFSEGENDIWSNNIVQLFSRKASWQDKIAYAGYRGLIYLRDKRGVKIKFVIPGY